MDWFLDIENIEEIVFKTDFCLKLLEIASHDSYMILGHPKFDYSLNDFAILKEKEFKTRYLNPTSYFYFALKTCERNGLKFFLLPAFLKML